MSDNLRTQLKESIKKLEEERLEVLKNDEKMFGSSPELEEEKTEHQYIPEETEIEEKNSKQEDNINDDSGEDIEEELSPLSHWAQEKKKTFQNLNAEAKKFILEREKDFNSDYTKKTQKLAEERKIAEKYRKAISPHEDYLKSMGLDPYEAAQSLIAFERQLANASPKEKAKIIKDLADQYKADFSEDEEGQEELHPTIKRLELEVREQKAYLARLEQESQKSKENDLARQVNEFKNTKDAAGNLKYPHFEKVMKKMGTIINTAVEDGEDITMDQAYQDACILNKELRDEVLNTYHKNRYKEEDNKKRLSASKNASFNVRSTGGETKQPPPQLSIRDALKRAMNEANSYS